MYRTMVSNNDSAVKKSLHWGVEVFEDLHRGLGCEMTQVPTRTSKIPLATDLGICGKIPWAAPQIQQPAYNPFDQINPQVNGKVSII